MRTRGIQNAFSSLPQNVLQENADNQCRNTKFIQKAF